MNRYYFEEGERERRVRSERWRGREGERERRIRDGKRVGMKKSFVGTRAAGERKGKKCAYEREILFRISNFC